MFDAVPEAVDTPVGLYNEKADEMKENPLDALPKDDIEIIDLDEE